MAGERQGETGLAGKKTIETIKAVRCCGSASVALCLTSLSEGLSWGHSISLESNLCSHIGAGCSCMHRQSVCPAQKPTGRGFDSGESHTWNSFLLRGMRCGVPAAACHMWDRQSCSCPLRFASQRNKRHLGCSQGIGALPEGLCSPVGICGRWKSIVVLDVGDVLGRCGVGNSVAADFNGLVIFRGNPKSE